MAWRKTSECVDKMENMIVNVMKHIRIKQVHIKMMAKSENYDKLILIFKQFFLIINKNVYLHLRIRECLNESFGILSH